VGDQQCAVNSDTAVTNHAAADRATRQSNAPFILHFNNKRCPALSLLTFGGHIVLAARII
jgi:hypothetical protein